MMSQIVSDSDMYFNGRMICNLSQLEGAATYTIMQYALHTNYVIYK